MARRYTDAEREARKQYSRYSRRIREQLKALEKRDPGNIQLQNYRGDMIPTLREMDQFFGGSTPLEKLHKFTTRVRGQYHSQLFTKRGYSEQLVKGVETLHKVGFKWVTVENAPNMWKFVDEMRARGLADIYGYKSFIGTYNRIKQDQSITPETLKASVDMWTRNARKYERRKEKDPDARPIKLYFRRKRSSNTDLER